jgi:hypothetical protein
MVLSDVDGTASPPTPTAATPAIRRFDWPRAGIGLLVTLVISVPTLALEEDWHGRPLIDQPHHKWVAAAIVVAAAFWIGAAVAASRRPWWLDGALHGMVVGLVASLLLVAADVVRRHHLHKLASPGVTRLWAVAVVSAAALGALGGALRLFDNRGERPSAETRGSD